MILNHNGLSSVRGLIARDRFVLSLVGKFSRPPRRVNARAGPVTRAASHVTKFRAAYAGLRFAARDRYVGFCCPPGPTKLRTPAATPFQAAALPKACGAVLINRHYPIAKLG